MVAQLTEEHTLMPFVNGCKDGIKNQKNAKVKTVNLMVKLRTQKNVYLNISWLILVDLMKMKLRKKSLRRLILTASKLAKVNMITILMPVSLHQLGYLKFHCQNYLNNWHTHCLIQPCPNRRLTEVSEMSDEIKGCGRSECHGHGDYSLCGKPHYNGIHLCDGCKMKIIKAQRDELLAALKYHQEQTRPIQQTIDLIAKCEQK